jgi:hypothetical protein
MIASVQATKKSLRSNNWSRLGEDTIGDAGCGAVYQHPKNNNFLTCRCYALCYERNYIAADTEILDPHGQRR